MLVALAASDPKTARAAPRPVFALVIGIDAYQGVEPLNGAVNDARVIAEALRKAAAREVVLLLDEAATRQRILDGIRDLSAKAARESGTLIISYAGHGAQELETIRGDEADGLDEVLLLAGFRPSTGDNAERLRDNDIYAALKAVPGNVDILFVVDACHSGTMTRSVDPRAVAPRTRMTRYGPIVHDQLPPPPLASKGGEAEDLQNVVFVASALDSEVTPELMIEDAWHGAVSWHFAKAVGGAADADKDGLTTLAEFRTYLVNGARLLAGSRQTPRVHYIASRGLEPFPVRGNRPGGARVATGVPLPKLWMIGKGPLPPGATAAASRETADLIWDRDRRQVVNNASGDVIAEQGARQNDVPFIVGVLDKHRALADLRTLASGPAIPLDIGPNGAGARYADGRVQLRVGARPLPQLQHLTIVDIAGDGTVQNLYPSVTRHADAGVLAAATPIERELRVQPPYGADHIIVVASAEDPVTLRTALRSLEGRQAASEATAAIAAAANSGTHVVSLVGLYSGP